MRALLVSGATNGTWSISWSEPWPQRNCGARPPSTTIGELFLCAEAIALMPLVTPGPAVSAQTPGSRVTFAQPSAANAAADSWRTSIRSMPSVAAAVVDGEEMAAREREQLGHAVRLQAARDQQPAVRLLRLGLLVPSGCLRLVLRCHRRLLARLARTLLSVAVA